MSSDSSVHIFGIRHHGPGSAHSLVKGLEALHPDALLVEGPPDAQEMLPWILNPDLIPPVALLLYVPDRPRQAVYYPFAEFSPEWQALKYGLTREIAVRFMDLPQAYQLAFQATEETAPAISESPLPNRRIFDPLIWLAEAAGYSDSERWWEHLVELRRATDLDLFAGILEMIAALRKEIEQEEKGNKPFFPVSPFGTLREAFMRQTLCEAQAEGFQKIAVVCGAWHAPALRSLPPNEQVDQLKGLSKVKVAASWVPWSYGRLSWESGYGAGIESPGWYEILWQAAKEGLSSSEVTTRWLTLAAHRLREEDMSASSAHVIEAVRLAETLSALRDRPVPGLPELNEAVQAVFCFGDDLPLRLIHEKLIVSERLGRVPDDIPMTPLQADLAHQQKHLRLPPEASQRDLDLDLRKPNDLERSYLLHRLNLLEIYWGTLQRVGGKSGTFHELWRLQWKPELAVKVVEASLWGNSVRDAALAFIRSKAELELINLPALTDLVNRTLLANLPEAVEFLMARLDAEAALASDTGQLMDALPALADALHYGNVRQMDTQMMARVVDGLVARICIGLPAACSSLDEEAVVIMFDRLNRVQSVVTLLQNEEYIRTWQAALTALVDQDGLHGLLAGRACAILLDRGVFSSEETSRRFGLALSTANEPSQAAAWAEGLLKNSGALLIHEDSLWKVIDDWVTTLPVDTFTQLLPLLRRTFSTFSAPERQKIGERVRQGAILWVHHAITPANFDLEQAAAVLPLIASLLGIGPEGNH